MPNPDYRRLPKIELHLHLDCSLTYQVVQRLNPAIDYETYRRAFVAPPKCTDLADYISRAVKGVDLMQTAPQLRMVTLDLFEQLQLDNVIYAEIRFAPLLHTQKGLSASEVVAVVNQTVAECVQQTGIEASIILCTLRHFSEKQSLETLALVEAFAGTYVTGFDIAADEAGFPIDAHLKAFEQAQALNLPLTAHAGEAKGPESVWETLRYLKPHRIGHGIRSIEDPTLMAYLKALGIHLEVCPTSNVQTNVVQTISDHPADALFNSGISMSLNTDARTISDVTLTSEYERMTAHFGWQLQHFKRCNLEAIEHAFTSPEKKALLRQQILETYV